MSSKNRGRLVIAQRLTGARIVLTGVLGLALSACGSVDQCDDPLTLDLVSQIFEQHRFVLFPDSASFSDIEEVDFDETRKCKGMLQAVDGRLVSIEYEVTGEGVVMGESKVVGRSWAVPK